MRTRFHAAIALGTLAAALAAAPANAQTPSLVEMLRILESRMLIDTQTVERAALEGAIRALDPRAAIVTPDALPVPGQTNGGVSRQEHWEDDLLSIKIHGLFADPGGAAVAELRDSLTPQPSGIVIDLRGAGGDNLDTLDAVCGLFAEDGAPIYELRDGFGTVLTTRCARATQPAPALPPVMLLIDNDTHGASEALAAVLRGHAGIMLIGTPTAGDSAQREYVSLSSNLLAYVSTRWLVPMSSADYAKTGLTPHIPVTDLRPTPAPTLNLSNAAPAPAPTPATPPASTNGPAAHELNVARALANRIGDDLVMRRAVDILLGLRALRLP